MAAFNVGKTEDKRVRTCISRRRVDRDNDAVETNRSMVRVTVVKTYKSRKSMQTTKNNLLATYLVESLKKKKAREKCIGSDFFRKFDFFAKSVEVGSSVIRWTACNSTEDSTRDN